jgi:hypothetical protein
MRRFPWFGGFFRLAAWDRFYLMPGGSSTASQAPVVERGWHTETFAGRAIQSHLALTHILWHRMQLRADRKKGRQDQVEDIVIIGGPNGAGKTTAAQVVLPQQLDIREFVNADEIARGLSPFNPEGAALAAGRLMIERILVIHDARRWTLIKGAKP